MNVTIYIDTQVYENYNTSGNEPYWKAKGGQKFKCVADSDHLMYSDNLVEVITSLLEEKSNMFVRFEYLGHEVDFHEMEDLGNITNMLR